MMQVYIVYSSAIVDCGYIIVTILDTEICDPKLARRNVRRQARSAALSSKYKRILR